MCTYTSLRLYVFTYVYVSTTWSLSVSQPVLVELSDGSAVFLMSPRLLRGKWSIPFLSSVVDVASTLYVSSHSGVPSSVISLRVCLHRAYLFLPQYIRQPQLILESLIQFHPAPNLHQIRWGYWKHCFLWNNINFLHQWEFIIKIWRLVAIIVAALIFQRMHLCFSFRVLNSSSMLINQ